PRDREEQRMGGIPDCREEESARGADGTRVRGANERAEGRYRVTGKEDGELGKVRTHRDARRRAFDDEKQRQRTEHGAGDDRTRDHEGPDIELRERPHYNRVAVAGRQWLHAS